jgi:hypothetical protein
MVPFSIAQFLDVISRYNQAVWPVQVFAYILGVAAVVLAFVRTRSAGRAISAVLGLMWLFMGLVFNFGFFVSINPAAWLFGSVYVVQGVLLLVFGTALGRLEFRPRFDVYGVFGAVFILYAMAVYPLLNGMLGHAWPHMPMFGIAPCPTTIFTFGILLWAGTRVRWYLWLIPLLWALVGTSAAFNLGMWEDLGLVVAGILGAVLLAVRNRRLGRARA